MTIVVAMKFDERILVMSDTMISDPTDRADNILPGRLKSIVINKWLTISYAGLSNQAIHIIRGIKKLSNISTELVVNILAEASRNHGDDLDFILCSHENAARLIKISSGEIFEGAEFHWIGNRQAVSELSKLEIPKVEINDLPEYMSQNEIIFTNTFLNYIRDGRCKGVGGVVINCLCSEFGHCYQDHAGAFSWDTIIIGQDDYVKRQELNQTGMYCYTYNVCAPAERGQAIIGFYLAQSNVGYIYDPLNYNDARKIKNMDLQAFSQLVQDAGEVLARREQ
ncbi:hypothetical protein [Methylobacter tundripaludum]|uniref:Uncharacterized protein n=1 Tax=Methylobacter tundripaludum (strain ATCC BAA-1195 / DSM 17260 / SV96) TaxID=697282 RepID=G3IVH3_METTV|nr:hypothetical protein [Methylobacter tundripaludum]EGW22900.1 hypothetical protein Mettu_1733 [Methylobacter tundripaludum SV96]